MPTPTDVDLFFFFLFRSISKMPSQLGSPPAKSVSSSHCFHKCSVCTSNGNACWQMAVDPLKPSSYSTQRNSKLSDTLKPTGIKLSTVVSTKQMECGLQMLGVRPRPRKWTSLVVSDTHLHPHTMQPQHSTTSSIPIAAASKKKVCLFHCNEMTSLAERVAAHSDSIQLRTISWRKFEDGFPNLFISNAHDIRGQHVAFLASFSSPAVIFEQLSVIYALPKLFISSFTLVLPFFPTGTSERVEEEGDIATAFALARILSNTPISRGGPTSLVIFDIHALQERFYFGDNVLPCFESGIPLLKKRLQQLPDSDNITIAFPDDGAWKRFHKQLQHFPMIICGKVREGDQRIVRLKEGNPSGRHVVIVDDLVQSGGTLIECQKVLAAHGAAKISAYVTHGIFPNRSWERFKLDYGGSPENGLTYFWITDSCPLTVKEVKNIRPFEVLSLAGEIASTLQI